MFAILIYALALACVAVVGILAWAFFEVAFRQPRSRQAAHQINSPWSPPLTTGEPLLQWAIETTAKYVERRLASPATRQTIPRLAREVLAGSSQAIESSPTTPHRTREYDCSSCRQQRISVTPVELFAIADFLRAERPHQVAHVLHQATANAQRLAQESPRQTEGSIICPLLCDERACAVNSVRPLQCRGWCPLPRGNADPVPTSSERVLDPHAQTLAIGIATGLSRGLQRRGLDGQPCELNHGLAIALRDSKAADRWLAGEPVLQGNAASA